MAATCCIVRGPLDILRALAAIKSSRHLPLIVGTSVGAVVLLSLVALFLFCRRRRLASKPVDKIGGVERGPDPDVDSSSLLDVNGQPADAEEAASQYSQDDKKKLISVSSVTGGLAQGATVARSAMSGFHQRLFKRPTKESTDEMELESCTTVDQESATSSHKAPRVGFLAKLGKTRGNSTKSMADSEDTEVAAPASEDPADSPPEVAREGFFAKITRKTKKNDSAAVDLVDDAGLTFQERLFKRPTTDSTATATPEIEADPTVVVSNEPSSILDGDANLEDGSPMKNSKKNGDTTKTASDGDNEPWTVVSDDSTMPPPPQEGSSPTSKPESPTELPPKPTFMLKLRHKFSNPSMIPTPVQGSTQKIIVDSSAVSEPELLDFDATEDAALRLAMSLSKRTTSGHGDQLAQDASSSQLSLKPVIAPPPVDADILSSLSTSESASPARSISTMKREQTRAIRDPTAETPSVPSYLAPPSSEGSGATATRSLSTMKRDQTRTISRDQNHSATNVLIQTPDGLQLLPGPGRVTSMDESRAVASELRDLREYVRMLEADLAAGVRRTPGEYIPAAPPPSYDESVDCTVVFVFGIIAVPAVTRPGPCA